MDCYDNRDGKASQEWEAFELFHTVVDQNYCVDNNRVFVVGYSTGGWLANMWGCYFAGDGEHGPAAPRRFAPRYHIRAQVVVSGGEPTEQPTCGGPVAALYIHDQYDNANFIAGNLASLRRVGAMNGCDTTYDDPSIQEPWHPELPFVGPVCMRFKGCPSNYPVVFCTTMGLARGDQSERVVQGASRFFDELPVHLP
jgi:poly(3-hydroxybutyrate) depolymerase